VRALVALLCTAFALGAAPEGLASDAGTLAKIKESGTVRIGFRENAVPFSWSAAGASPRGYSIDLCLAIVEDLSKAAGKALRVAYVPVTPESRLDLVTQGRIDLECGSTTVTEERQARVAFSPLIFVGGTRLLVKRGNAIYSLRDMGGKTVVAVAGTTNARALLAQGSRARDMRVRTSRGYDEAITMLDTDNADALAADDVLIAGLIAERRWQDRFIMVGDPITREPYAIAFPRDDAALAAAVHATFARLATSGDLRRIYGKWFLQPLPTGATLGLPMGVHLSSVFKELGLPPE
jgi:glutamate/aspartate transport system substrate-binding protein